MGYNIEPVITTTMDPAIYPAQVGKRRPLELTEIGTGVVSPSDKNDPQNVTPAFIARGISKIYGCCFAR
jgi:hypothetical protein